MQLSSANIWEIGFEKIKTNKHIKTLKTKDIIIALVSVWCSAFVSLFATCFAVILDIIKGIPLDTNVKRTMNIEKLIW